jgi:carbonic anhydrase
MRSVDQLLLSNKSWATECKAQDPEFFSRLARDQRPEFLWIGCSDSRVPANQITGTAAGEIFVHRNIANVFVPTDLNLLSVLQYAVEVLEVKHVIVCGHRGCGGVRAAMSPNYMGPISHWLSAIRDVYETHYEAVCAAPEAKRADLLCELNVRAQVEKLAKSSIVQGAWHKRSGPWLHGWVYGLDDGILRELVAVEPRTAPPPAHQLTF